MPGVKLFILCGIPFSGKTTLAKKLSKLPQAVRIDLDEIKFRLFGDNITDDNIDQPGWDKIYQQMYQDIKNSLISGKTVIHDTGNFTLKERNLVRDIAAKLGINALTIFVDTPAKVAYQRLAKNRQSKERFDVSDNDFNNCCLEMEIPSNAEPHIIYDGVKSPDVPVLSYLL